MYVALEFIFEVRENLNKYFFYLTRGVFLNFNKLYNWAVLKAHGLLGGKTEETFLAFY